ncbi:MAG: hypothetical protein CM15mP74_00030 [Halieaceae bacterium]|nr:MAG: hypothetical protein CM15mP74_00030 [Halieaceae bacterium]
MVPMNIRWSVGEKPFYSIEDSTPEAPVLDDIFPLPHARVLSVNSPGQIKHVIFPRGSRPRPTCWALKHCGL